MLALFERVQRLPAGAELPKNHRRIPKSMQLAYLAKVRGRMHAYVALDAPAASPDGDVLTVPVAAHDRDGQLVCRDSIDIWITQGG